MLEGIEQVNQVCIYHFCKWHKNKRIVVCFLLTIIMSFLLTEKIVNFSLEQNTQLQIFEPYIWTFGDGSSILLSALLIILLYADMPFLNNAVPYYLIRINVFKWTIGQILYLFLSMLTYTLFLLGITVAMCGSNAFIGNKWSNTAALLGYSNYSKSLNIPAKLKTFTNTSPYECMITIFFLLLAYMIFSVLLMMYLTIKKGRKTGIIGVFLFHLVGSLLNVDFFEKVLGLSEKTLYKAYTVCGWISPINHATYHMHNFGYDTLPTLAQSFLLYGIGIIILLVLIIKAMKKYSFNFTGTEATI